MLRGLIKHLKYEGVLKTPSIIRALKRVDRKDFIPEEYKREAYGDYPIPIGFGQTIPQPHTIIFMIEHLQPEAGDKILEVGSGSGWAASILGNVVGRKGHVYGVEIVPELVVVGKQNVAKYSRGNVEIHQAADNILGMPEHAPYDKILVSASGHSLPEELVEQLKVGGRMIIPIGDTICKITRTTQTTTDIKKYKGFVFVPLIH